jgi:hypothetical protein
VAQPDEITKQYIQTLSDRAEAVQQKRVSPDEDNMRELHVTATNHEENVTKAVAA